MKQYQNDLDPGFAKALVIFFIFAAIGLGMDLANIFWDWVTSL